MGGFINKSRERVPGAKIVCRCCKQELDEYHFSFSTSGYYSYCFKCSREKAKEKRDRDKLNLLKGIEIKKDDPDPFRFRRDIAHIMTCVRVGDIYRINGEDWKVDYITRSLVGMVNDAGKRETYIWVDMARIVIDNMPETKGG